MRKLFALKTHYQKIKALYARYERWLMPATLAVGFVVDYITFINIQVNTALVILFVYWLVAALAIAFMFAFDAGKLPEKFKFIRLFIPLLVQFTFGGLLSNSFIFYWFSGSVWVSWPFVLAFVILMVSNDALRGHFLKPTVQLSVYFFATFSIFSVTLPFVFSSLNPWLFLLAGGLALACVSLFVWLIGLLSASKNFNQRDLVISIACIYFTVNFFYFAGLIPPVPLAIREIGLYHSVARVGKEYILIGEAESFWERIVPGKTIRLLPGEYAYIFSSIFAPKELNTPIVHEWQYKDEQQGKWVVKDKLSFTLIGGRREGFRGYSVKSNLPAGAWQVFVKTERNQTLGRMKFKIERAKAPAELMEVIK